MKKIYLFIAMAIASVMPAMAQETVKTLYDQAPVEVTWDTPLKIDADAFSTDVNVGNYIYITFSETTDVIEIKANGTWLPGSCFTTLGNDAKDFKAYITVDMLEALKEYGLEICGAKFTVTSVSICNDGFVMPEGAVWGGYSWVDGWGSLEIFKTAFDKYNGQRWLDIYMSDNTHGYDGYYVDVLTQWDPEIVLVANDQIERNSRVAFVDLQDINLTEALAKVNSLIIHANNEAGNPFNIIAVALRPNGVVNGVDNITTDATDGLVNVFNLQGMLVASKITLEEAKATLPAGLYIANGKKFLVK